MCGICGIVGGTGGIPADSMRDLMRHRGPDDKGEFISRDVYLGHRRLSIVDIDTGHQPMSNEDGSLRLIYNGEIYNHETLKRELKTKGHKFITKSDGEVILHLYEEVGDKVVEHLEGMFAIALWDSGRRKLFLARDRLGIKPLYYTLSGNRLLFASEIKSILSQLNGVPDIDWTAFEALLTLRYIPSPLTMFERIHKLPPAHTLTSIGGKVKVDRYWRLPDNIENDGLTENEAAEELVTLFRDAIKKRLMGEVEAGAYLSGGIDSGSILAMMTEIAGEGVHTFSVGFNGSANDESGNAASTAGFFRANHHPLTAGSIDADTLLRIMWHLEEPLADATVIPTYQMAEATSPYTKVVLSGEGADELFLGYPKYAFLLNAEKFRGGPVGYIIGKLAGQGFKNTWLKRVGEYAASRDKPSDSFLRLSSVFSREERADLLTPAAVRSIGKQNYAAGELDRFMNESGTGHSLESYVRWEISNWLPDDLLLKNDKMTMAHGVESRLPFLDHRLVEFAASLPIGMKLKGLNGKKILRKAMTGLLPERVRKQKKRGFTVPLEPVFRAEREFFNNYLFSETRLRRQGIFNHEYVKKLLKGDLSRGFRRRQIWSLASFQLWWEVFIEGKDHITKDEPHMEEEELVV